MNIQTMYSQYIILCISILFINYVYSCEELDIPKFLEEYTLSWSGNLDGRHCRRLVDLFNDNGKLFIPTVSSRYPLPGQKPIYDHCENQILFGSSELRHDQGIGRIETFISGLRTFFVNQTRELAFQRTSLIITNETFCRMTNHAMVLIKFDLHTKIKEQHDFFDLNEYQNQWKLCSWPDRNFFKKDDNEKDKNHVEWEAVHKKTGSNIEKDKETDHFDL